MIWLVPSSATVMWATPSAFSMSGLALRPQVPRSRSCALAIEPWNVLGEEPSAGGTSRYVDSSVERIEVRCEGIVPGRHDVLVNGHLLGLRPTVGTVENAIVVKKATAIIQKPAPWAKRTCVPALSSERGPERVVMFPECA